jgi:hypothetical protein
MKRNIKRICSLSVELAAIPSLLPRTEGFCSDIYNRSKIFELSAPLIIYSSYRSSWTFERHIKQVQRLSVSITLTSQLEHGEEDHAPYANSSSLPNQEVERISIWDLDRRETQNSTPR